MVCFSKVRIWPISFDTIISLTQGNHLINTFNAEIVSSLPSDAICIDHSVHVPSQWETTLHCNVFSHWLGTYTKWSLHMVSGIFVNSLCSRDLGQHWLRQWLVAWRHQAITWINVDWSSVTSSGIHIWAISQEMPQLSVTKIYLNITYMKFHSNIPEANELTLIMTMTDCPATQSHHLKPMPPSSQFDIREHTSVKLKSK